jgi:DNA-binding response OmpR family regulator
MTMGNAMRTLLIQAGQPSHPLDHLLRDRGREAICCEGVGPALAAIAAEPVDLVIVDLGLPGIDFRGLSRALRDLAPGRVVGSLGH